MKFFLKHKTAILRTLGGFMLLVGFVIHFWVTPKEGISEMEIAAANVARMEASVAGKSSSSKLVQPSAVEYIEELKKNQDRQVKYLTILSMVLGVGFLGFSFMKRREEAEAS